MIERGLPRKPRTVILHNVGHAVNSERPREVSRHYLQFLSDVEEQRLSFRDRRRVEVQEPTIIDKQAIRGGVQRMQSTEAYLAQQHGLTASPSSATQPADATQVLGVSPGPAEQKSQYSPLRVQVPKLYNQGQIQSFAQMHARVRSGLSDTVRPFSSSSSSLSTSESSRPPSPSQRKDFALQSPEVPHTHTAANAGNTATPLPPTPQFHREPASADDEKAGPTKHDSALDRIDEDASKSIRAPPAQYERSASIRGAPSPPPPLPWHEEDKLWELPDSTRSKQQLPLALKREMQAKKVVGDGKQPVKSFLGIDGNRTPPAEGMGHALVKEAEWMEKTGVRLPDRTGAHPAELDFDDV